MHGKKEVEEEGNEEEATRDEATSAEASSDVGSTGADSCAASKSDAGEEGADEAQGLGGTSQRGKPAHPACVAGDDACKYHPVDVLGGPKWYVCGEAWEDRCHAQCSIRFLTLDLKTVLLQGPSIQVGRPGGMMHVR